MKRPITRTCSVPGCSRSRTGSAYCNHHAKMSDKALEAEGPSHPVQHDSLSDSERAARCAWIVYLDTLFDGGGIEEEFRLETTRTFETLPLLAESDARQLHLKWRSSVISAMRQTLGSFCPGENPECCDEQFWPKPNSLDAESIRAFVATILHGNDEHQAWLREAAECFIRGEAVPEGTSDFNAAFIEAARNQLRREKFAQLQKLAERKVNG